MNANAITATLPKSSAGPARIRWLASDAWVLAKRQFAHIRQIPEKLFDVTLQPLMFVLLFAYVFGGVIHVPGGGDYHEYLIGGILVQTLAFGMMGPGVSLATDLGEGIIDRFSSLPMSRPAYLIGHLIGGVRRDAAGDRDHGRQRPDRRLGDQLQLAAKRGRLRPAVPARDRDDLARNAGRGDRPLARRRAGDRLRRRSSR